LELQLKRRAAFPVGYSL